MHPKTYIIIIMIIVVLILTYHANIFKSTKEFLTAQNTIIKPDNTNIDNLDVKQLKTIVSQQNEIINKQSEVINKYVENTENSKKRFNKNIIKPDENIDKYFDKIRDETDEVIKKNQTEEDNIDLAEHYKSKIQIVKSYLEDPIMRGANIYESEQYSKLLEIGNIKIDDSTKLPNPMYYSKNFK
jgi:hypothetical protein